MNLDAYMDDFGRDLERAAARRRSRRRLARRALLPALPVGAALAVAVTALPGGGGDVDAVAAARAALAPDGEIVHMKIELREGERLFMPSEQWYAANPTRWRTRFEGPRIPGEKTRIETGFSDGRLRFYDERTDTVTIWRNAKVPHATAPGLFGGDPATDLREQLGNGDVRDDGVVTYDGRPARRLVREHTVKQMKQRFVYYTDPVTFEPIGGQLSIRHKDGRILGGPRFTVTKYERLPLNATTERLLELDKTPKTRYVLR
jgi:hypothetical protein